LRRGGVVRFLPPHSKPFGNPSAPYQRDGETSQSAAAKVKLMSSTTPPITKASLNEDALPPDTAIFGQTESLRLVRLKVEKVAVANVPVLICGESGTGKEVIAKLIHRNSTWCTGPFVKVSCPALPASLLESELFGYVKGAFTGANGSKPGKVEQANGGTLVMDEIAELDPTLQAKLLQLLQDGQYCPIGAETDRRVDVRVICITNHRLEQEIEAGSFRQDLFYRVNVVRIDLPPLRQRTEDIPFLADYFLGLYNSRYQRSAPPVSDYLLETFRRYHWPGNIRELENLIRRYVLLGVEDAIQRELLEPPGRSLIREVLWEIPPSGQVPLKKLTHQITLELERKVIHSVLQATRWNQRQAAKRLGISYRALLYKIRQAGLPSKRALLHSRSVAGKPSASANDPSGTAAPQSPAQDAPKKDSNGSPVSP